MEHKRIKRLSYVLFQFTPPRSFVCAFITLLLHSTYALIFIFHQGVVVLHVSLVLYSYITLYIMSIFWEHYMCPNERSTSYREIFPFPYVKPYKIMTCTVFTRDIEIVHFSIHSTRDSVFFTNISRTRCMQTIWLESPIRCDRL